MNAQQISVELGVTERTVRRWIADGKLNAHREGRSLVVDLDEARMLAAPAAAKELSELRELQGLRERYAELEQRYEQLLRLLDPSRRVVR